MSVEKDLMSNGLYKSIYIYFYYSNHAIAFLTMPHLLF